MTKLEYKGKIETHYFEEDLTDKVFVSWRTNNGLDWQSSKFEPPAGPQPWKKDTPPKELLFPFTLNEGDKVMYKHHDTDVYIPAVVNGLTVPQVSVSYIDKYIDDDNYAHEEKHTMLVDILSVRKPIKSELDLEDFTYLV